MTGRADGEPESLVGQPEIVTAGGRIHQAAGLMLFAGLSAAAFVLAGRLQETSRG
jgi:hypothetical protein